MTTLGQDGATGARDGAVQGRCDQGFEMVRDTLAANLANGADVGASVAVSLNGELVVDLWGGVANETTGAAWERDTITNVWSTTKTMTALSALIVADRGELDFHAPVARYWPEFAACGKADIEVRHLMSHTAGLSGWSEPMATTDLYDWEKATSLLAAQEPWWVPGTASGYHAITQGYLVGEVVRRITGQSLGTFFAQEVAGPLGADFHIGLPPSEDNRVARVIPPAGTLADAEMEKGSIAYRTLSNPPMNAEASWAEDWRRAEIPAAGGHGNARSVTQVQSVLACGGIGRRPDGTEVRLLSEAGCRAVFEEQIHGTDLVLGVPFRLGIGYGLTSEEMPLGPNPNVCFWGGWGGSLVVADLDAGLCVAYMMNRMESGLVGDMRGGSIVMAAFAAAGLG